MMEEKLMKAANELPVPALEFESIEAVYTKGTLGKNKPRRIARLVLVAVLLIGLCTTAFAYGAVKYGLWSGCHSTAYSDVKLLTWRYHYNLPREFQGREFSNMSTLYGAPQGVSHMEALLKPTYTMHTVDYEDSDGKWIDIAIGSTRMETWKYHFSVGNDGFCNYEEVTAGSQWKTEYGEYELYVCSISDRHRVHWLDSERQLVLSLSTDSVKTQKEVVELAKALIDLNE